ncbi:MAG: tetratricopeptide repeat protein [Ignavibacteriaceae bacterium]|nr:tetratricopeptide repeat protein [Ignavibacteriaceae bacterium]
MRQLLFFISLILFSAGYSFPQSSTELFSSGMNSYTSMDYVEAIVYFEKFFEKHSEIDEINSTAKYYCAESYYKLGESQAAIERYEFLCNNFRWSAFRDAALYKLGLLYLEVGKFDKSRSRFNILINDYPKSEYANEALYWIGETYLQEDKSDEAVNVLEEAIIQKQSNKYLDYSIYSLAYVFEKKSDYKKAVYYYDQILSFHKTSSFAPISQFRIGYCYFKLKEYHSAIIELKNPILQSLESKILSEVKYILASSYYKLGEFLEAENLFREFILEYPDADLIRDAKYGLGWTLFQQEKFNDAFEIFNALSMESDSIGIYSFYWKAESKRYAHREQEAAAIFNDFLKTYPNSSLINEAKLKIGGIYFASNKINDSENLLEELKHSENKLTQAKALVILGELNLKNQKYDEAKRNFYSAYNLIEYLSSTRSAAMLGLGISLFHLKQYNESIKILIDLEKEDNNYASDKVNYYIAENYYAKGNFSDAIKRYNKVNKSNRTLANLSIYGKAYSYFNLKDYENAVIAFSEFINQNYTDDKASDAKLRLADSHYGNKNYKAASKIYKEIFLSGGDVAKNPYVQYQYAQALYKGGNSSEAISQFRILQSTFPESEYADKSMFIIGWIFFQNGSYSEAINSYRALMNMYPNSELNPIAYCSIGDAFFNQSKYDSAIVNYQKVLKLYPNSDNVFDAVNGMLYSHLAQNRDKDAIELVDNFVLKNPNRSFSDELFFKKAEIYYNQSAYEEAKSSYSDFITRFPRSELIPSAHYWIGKCAQSLGKLEDAVISFNNVIDNFPQSDLASAAVIEIGNIYNHQKQFDLAIANLEKGSAKLKNSPQLAEILFIKATSYANKGEIEKAYQTFDEIVQYHGESIFADKSKFEIGLIEYSAKRYDNAVLYLSSISQSRTDEIGAKAQYYLGMTLFEQSKTTEAISAFVRTRTVYQQYIEWVSRSTLMLGDCYKKLKDTDKAKQFYQEVLAKHRSDELGKTAQKKLRELE